MSTSPQNNNPFSFLRTTTPSKLGSIVLLFGTIGVVLWGFISSDTEAEWFISSVSLSFYTWASAAIWFFIKKNKLIFLGKSIAWLIFVGAYFITLATFLSGISIFSSYEFTLIFLITFLFYFLSILIVTLIKTIAEIMGVDY